MNPRRAAILGGVLAVVMVVLAIVVIARGGDRNAVGVAGAGSGGVSATGAANPPLPPLTAGTDWINTAPLTAADLRGKVVLVDFWDASCINCRRTFPFLRKLQSTYASRGLVIVGVHSPEFAFEKPAAYVTREAKDLGVTWPVLNDPDLKVWDAFDNEYWPATYLADRQGRERYTHFGEGDEDQVELAVRTLLDEGGDAGPAATGTEAPPPNPITEERYLGAERGINSIAEGVVEAGTTANRHDTVPPAQQEIALTGSFKGAAQYLVAEPGAEVALGFDAADVYAVLSPDARPATVEVRLDGRPVPADARGDDVHALPDGTTVATVDHDDLYTLIRGSSNREGVITLIARDQPLQLFTFTFG
ncbi:MAG TPA: redoxin family protein [Mycobacteriales bacterium]|nr:redoxin family protein [Mycobacteriales bacterium]